MPHDHQAQDSWIYLHHRPSGWLRGACAGADRLCEGQRPDRGIAETGARDRRVARATGWLRGSCRRLRAAQRRSAYSLRSRASPTAPASAGWYNSVAFERSRARGGAVREEHQWRRLFRRDQGAGHRDSSKPTSGRWTPSSTPSLPRAARTRSTGSPQSTLKPLGAPSRQDGGHGQGPGERHHASSPRASRRSRTPSR